MVPFDATSMIGAMRAATSERAQLAREQLRMGGVAILPEILACLDDAIRNDADEVEPALATAIGTLLDAFESDPRSPLAYAALKRMPQEHAAALAGVMIRLAFSYNADLAALTEGQFIGLVGLLSAGGEHERAAIVLSEARDTRPSPAIRHAAWLARCRWAGCDPDVGAHWPGGPIRPAGAEAETAARAQIDRAPLTLDAHRLIARQLLLRDSPVEGLEALATALALPFDPAAKHECAGELAMALAVLTARDQASVLRTSRIAWTLAMNAPVAHAAADLLGKWNAAGTLPFLDAEEVALLQDRLRTIQAVTAYPVRDGKPHVETVWLEITNFCNQKCTFCPDMFREDARAWLPLDRVKAIIDELAESVSVGSMQLNAYGEPLLHPNIAEILAYLREKRLPWPTFFTTHGLTLVDKKLKQLSQNYPQGIAVSLHNDSQESYAATRSAKIGDYATLVTRVSALMRQMATERAPSHLRLYQITANEAADARVDQATRDAFADTPERLIANVRRWEAIAADIAAALPGVEAHVNSDAAITRAFHSKHGDGDGELLWLLHWDDVNGARQSAFLSARPLDSYAQLLLEHDPNWSVERKLLSTSRCHFTKKPSLAIFATGRLGMCCLDLNSTATFGSLDDFGGSINAALMSPQATTMFAELSNGVATSTGCQICLGSPTRRCGTD
ncbi:radical SAM protein [Sphingomonas sp. CJ20]